LLKLAGIRQIRFHDLRHTFATLWLDQGESPKYIQVQLGHASRQVTMDRYGHLLPDVNQQAARRLEDSLFGPSVRKPLESPAFNSPGSSQSFDFTRVSEGIRTPDPWGHNPFGMTTPLGKSMIYRGVFLYLLG
jgi:hypothetical protein